MCLSSEWSGGENGRVECIFLLFVFLQVGMSEEVSRTFMFNKTLSASKGGYSFPKVTQHFFI